MENNQCKLKKTDKFVIFYKFLPTSVVVIDAKKLPFCMGCNMIHDIERGILKWSLEFMFIYEKNALNYPIIILYDSHIHSNFKIHINFLYRF